MAHKSKRIVIIGGALTGPAAAARAREVDEHAHIVLLERNRDVSYAVGALASHLSGEIAQADSLNQERAEFFRDVHGIEVRTGALVTAIDARRRRVAIADGEPVSYDRLIFAAGAGTVVPPALATPADNVRALRTVVDVEHIDARLTAGAREIVVVGGGFIGVETADALTRRGQRVTIIERGERLLPWFSPAFSAEAGRALERAGCRVLLGKEVLKAERQGGLVTRLLLRGGDEVACDLVILAAGVRPRTELLRKAGVKLLPNGTVAIKPDGRTSLPDVYACGVCVSLPHAVTGKPVWLAQAAVADKTAQVVGAAAAGAKVSLGKVLGTAVVRVGSLTLARTGLGFDDAKKHARAAFGVVCVHPPARDPALPGTTPLSVSLYYDARSGKLLGGEALGEHGADKRIDVLAAAILGGLGVDQLATMDLGYAPPYAAQRDALNVAGIVAGAARRKLARGLSGEEVAAKKRFQIIDVRTARTAPTLEGARRLPLERLRKELAGLKKQPLVFVCEDGRRSYLAARLATQLGRRDAAYLSGGLLSWRQAGRALVSSK